MGDGNHSLATAKACWEQLKPTLAESERAAHPARFALVEITNIHGDGLKFHPIHRVVFDNKDALADIRSELKRSGCDTRVEYLGSLAEASANANSCTIEAPELANK